MRIVWEHGGELSVRDVRDAVPDLAYTTVMTMMRILEEKGYLKKTLVDRAHVYKPAQRRQQVIAAMVRDFLERVFDGVPDSLLVHLAKDNKLTEKQRRIVKQLIEDAEP